MVAVAPVPVTVVSVAVTPVSVPAADVVVGLDAVPVAVIGEFVTDDEVVDELPPPGPVKIGGTKQKM